MRREARRRALVAGCIGNLVEWYDFALFGAFATIIAATFFPGADAVRGLTVTLGVFGVAFLARPAGALVFGHYGDRVGRRRALAAGILLMALVTAGIGVLPGYVAIGWLAPALLVALRVVQGVAVGGEFGGSAALVVEYAPADRRGWYGGWQWATIGLGFATGIGATAVASTVVSEPALLSWGWRVPFLIALPLGIVGLYVRNRLDETPAFRAVQRGDAVSRAPLVDALRTSRRQVLIGFAVVAAVTATFNIFYVFLPSYLATTGQASLSKALGTAVAGVVLGSVSAPVFGRWSDRIGRRPVLIGGVSALLAVLLPASWLVQRGDTAAMLVGYVLIGVPLGSLALSAFLAELFPTRLRYTGLSLSFGVASAIFGGSAPLAAAVLARITGTLWLPIGYATIVMVVALVAVLMTPETAHRPLDADQRRGRTVTAS